MTIQGQDEDQELIVKIPSVPVPERSYPRPATPQVSAVMRANRKTGSRPEQRVRSELHRRGLRFRKNMRIQLDKGSVEVDIAFPARRIAVFIDGCFWHGCKLHGNIPKHNSNYWEAKIKRDSDRDATVTARLTSLGWLPLRFWEHDEAGLVVTIVASAWTTRSPNNETRAR